MNLLNLNEGSTSQNFRSHVPLYIKKLFGTLAIMYIAFLSASIDNIMNFK